MLCPFVECMDKTKHRFHFFVFVILAACFSGCGDDPNLEPTNSNNVLGDGNLSNPPVNAAFVASGNSAVSGSVNPKIPVPAAPIAPIVNVEKTDIEVRPDYSTGENEEALDFPQLLAKTNDAPYTGPFTRAFPNGKREFSANYKNGLLEGEAQWWNFDGTLASSAQVENGMIVKWEISAQVEDAPSSLDADPVEIIFFGNPENANAWSTSNIEEDSEVLLVKESGAKVSGAVKIHDENRRLLSYAEYKDGQLHGRKAEWFPNGVKSIESNHLNGKKHGAEVWRHENGHKKWEMNHINGEQHGLAIEWDENGNISKQDLYENGRLVDE